MCVQCQEDQVEIHYEQTPEEGISLEERCVSAHACAHVLELHSGLFFMYLFSINVRANMDLHLSTQSRCMYVCVELVKECTFD